MQRKEVFQELATLDCCDLRRAVVNTAAKRRCFANIDALRRVAPFEKDIFSVDNTNAIEGFFNGIKGRTRHSPLTLLDVFNAVDTTEKTVLAMGTPFAPRLPGALHDSLVLVVPGDVLHVLSLIGVKRFLYVVVSSLVSILSDTQRVLN